jgi:hypothetical protein
MDPWGDRRFQAWKERLFGNQSINQEEEPWADRRRDREIAFVICGDHHPESSSSVVLCVVVMM